mgnify:CR=1 FL=1
MRSIRPNDIPPESPVSISDNPWTISHFAAGVILVGLIIRLFTFQQTLVVNTDAIFYIQQAKAVYYGLADRITSGYPYLTNYSLFIVIGYLLLGDWITAASGVSIFFGTLVLIPLYWLSRRFFDEKISILALLTMALSPSFVNMSRDVLRGPTCWFFMMIGIFLFVLHLERRRPAHLLIGCTCLLLSAWARIEVLLFPCVSALFLLFKGGRTRWKDLIWFLSPAFLMVAVALGKVFFFHMQPLALIGPERIIERLTVLADRYDMVRTMLSQLIDQQYPGHIYKYFLEKVRNLVWLIAIGALFVQITRAFFFPFFLLFIGGGISARTRVLRDSRLGYLTSLSGAALLLLFAQVIYLWAMFDRWIALFLFPAYVFIGFGLIALINAASKKIRWKPAWIYVMVMVVVVTVSLPKNLRFSIRDEKLVFAEIGRFIADREQGNLPVSIAGTFKEILLVDFYTHLNFKGAPVFDRNLILEKEKSEWIETIANEKTDYFIWDEESMGNTEANWIQQHPVTPVNEWRSEKLGKLILYRVKS